MGISCSLERVLQQEPNEPHAVCVRCAMAPQYTRRILKLFSGEIASTATGIVRMLDESEAQAMAPLLAYCDERAIAYRLDVPVTLTRTLVVTAPAPVVRELAALPYVEAVTTCPAPLAAGGARPPRACRSAQYEH